MNYNFPSDNRELAKDNIGSVHSVLLRMLKVFHEICNAHEIDYWLEYGTLLGAIRHKGFIPWDNEIDVGMLRPDFDRFIKIAKWALPIDIFLQTKDTDIFYTSSLVEAKLRDKYSNYQKFTKANPMIKWHNGIQIDIFVYDFDSKLEKCITNSFERTLSGRRIYLKKEEIEYTVIQDFEDMACPIPVGYNAYLHRNYGDYWQLPNKIDQIPEYVEVFTPCDHTEILSWQSIL